MPTEHSSNFKDKTLDDFSFTIKESIRWGDLDSFGHLNNAIYFTLFENVRVAYFYAIGFMDLKEDSQVGPILAHTECHFRQALTYPNNVTIATRTSTLRSHDFFMEYAIFNDAKESSLAAYGSGRVVCFNYARGEKTEIPEELLDRMQTVEGRLLK